MRYFFIISLVLSFSIVAFSQTKKANVKPQVNPQASSLKIKEGILNSEDYGYYVLVRRKMNFEELAAKPYYSLSPRTDYLGQTPAYNGSSIILDIRTGKEVAWWPSTIRTYYSKTMGQLFVKDNKGINAHLENGTLLYQSIFIMPNTSIYKGVSYKLSNNWQKAIITFNNDIVIGDFNLKTGLVENPAQVTFSGVFECSEAQMHGDNVLTFGLTVDSYMVNIKSGKYTKTGDWRHSNIQITDKFYTLADEGFWSLTNQSFQGINGNFLHCFWINENQTKYVYGKRENGQFNLYYTDGNKEIKLNWPLLAQEAATFPKSFNHRYSPIFSRYLHSPSGNRVIRRDPTPNARGQNIYVCDVLENWERVLKIKGAGFLADNDGIGWSDDNHIFFNAKSEMTTIDGQQITTDTQGTYVYDISTGISTRITPYLISTRQRRYGRDGSLILTWQPDTNYVVFEANNFLFRCRVDGTGLEPIVKISNVYTLEGHFLTENPDLK